MSKKIAFSGVCSAMALVLMLLTAVLPANTLFLLCVSTVFIPIILIKCGRTYSICALIAISSLVFIFVPDKILCLEFLLLGIYTLCKSLIERIGILWEEWTIKLMAYFAVAVTVKELVFGYFAGVFRVILTGAVIFIIYDIALSVAISYISKKFNF